MIAGSLSLCPSVEIAKLRPKIISIIAVNSYTLFNFFLPHVDVVIVTIVVVIFKRGVHMRIESFIVNPPLHYQLFQNKIGA